MLQSIATCWSLLSLNEKSWNNIVTSSRNASRTWSQCMPGKVFTPRARENMAKTSSHFPNFDTSNTWQMGHNSREGIFLGQELLLDFAAWLDLTSNAENTITIYQLPSKFQNTFWFFKTCWWLTGLSRLYDASQPPGRHTRYFNTMLKILVDRALMQHISFLFNGILFDAPSIHVLCSRHNNQCKQSVPRFPLYILFYFDFKTAKIQWNTL